MGSDRYHEHQQRMRNEWAPLNRAVDLIRSELNLHADTAPGTVAIKALEAISALRALHDIEHPDCDGEDCPARLALLGTTIVSVGTVLVDTAHLSDEEFMRDYPLMDPLPPAVLARAKRLLIAAGASPVHLRASTPKPVPVLSVDTSSPTTVTLPVVPSRPVLDAHGNAQFYGGKMIESPDAPAAPIHIAAGKSDVTVEGARHGQALSLAAGESVTFEWESRPPGWRLRTWGNAGS